MELEYVACSIVVQEYVYLGDSYESYECYYLLIIFYDLLW